jgi:hypothetical protein
MRKHRIRRPSTALVVACLALLVALGGTSYATVLQVPRGSVGTLQLQRNAVKAAKLAPNAVRTKHVLNGALLAEDFRAGQLPSGPKGDKGDKGDRGAPGLSGLQPVTRMTASDSNAIKSLQTPCPSGKRAVGGGAFVNTTDQAAPVALRRSNLTGESWMAVALEFTTYAGSWSLSVTVICATVAP